MKINPYTDFLNYFFAVFKNNYNISFNLNLFFLIIFSLFLTYFLYIFKNKNKSLNNYFMSIFGLSNFFTKTFYFYTIFWGVFFLCKYIEIKYFKDIYIPRPSTNVFSSFWPYELKNNFVYADFTNNFNQKYSNYKLYSWLVEVGSFVTVNNCSDQMLGFIGCVEICEYKMQEILYPRNFPFFIENPHKHKQYIKSLRYFANCMLPYTFERFQETVEFKSLDFQDRLKLFDLYVTFLKTINEQMQIIDEILFKDQLSRYYSIGLKQRNIVMNEQSIQAILKLKTLNNCKNDMYDLIDPIILLKKSHVIIE